MTSLRHLRIRRSASCFAAALLAFAYCLAGQSAFAASGTWNGTNGTNWSNASNWSASPAPGTGDTATFNNAGNGNTTLSLGGGVTINTVLFDTSSAAAYTIGSGAVGSQTLTLNFSGAITVNSTVTNSQLFNATITLGTDSTSTGSFTFTNNSTTGGQLLTIAGNVTELHSNNNNPARTLNLAGSGNGLISGIIDGNGASNGSNARPLVSVSKSGSGTWTLSGTNTFAGGTTITAGTILAGNNAALGTGSVLLGGTTGAANASLLTNGAFTISNGITVQAGNTGVATIGGNTDNNSTFSGAVTLNHDLTISQVANAGANALSITGGISSGTAGTKTVTFAGPGNINVSAAAIANGSGTVAVNVTGGKTTFNVANTYTGLTNVTAGTLVEGVSDALGTGALTVNGPTAVFDLGANHTDSVGTVTLAGGGSITGTGTSALTSTGTFEMQSGSASVILAGSGIVLNKTTIGTVTLSGANTYSGGTSVTAGTLLVTNTSGSGTGTGTVTVSNSGTTLAGGTTAGTGGISGPVTVNSGANLSPGTSTNGVGTTAILHTGALTLSSGSNFQVDINGTTVGTQYDQLAVTNHVLNIAGSHLLVSVGAAFTQSAVGDTFAILSNITAGAITGQFQGLSEGATFNSGSDQFRITYLGNAGDGTNGNDIVLTLTAVPEPSTWLAAALALGAMGYMQLRKRSRARGGDCARCYGAKKFNSCRAGRVSSGGCRIAC